MELPSGLYQSAGAARVLRDDSSKGGKTDCARNGLKDNCLFSSTEKQGIWLALRIWYNTGKENTMEEVTP